MNTTTLPRMTPAQYKLIEEQTACWLHGLAQDADLRATLAKMYCAAFPNAQEDEAFAAADEVLGAVDNFSDLYDDASWKVEHSAYRDVEPYIGTHIERFIAKTEKGMSLAEACTFWKQFAAALACANAQLSGGRNHEVTLKWIEQIRVSEEEATPQLLGSLHAQVARVIGHSSVTLVGLGEHEKLLRAMADGDKAGKLLIEVGEDERAFRAAMSMMTGILTRKGELPAIPDTLTLQQSTVLFCTLREKIKIEERYGRDSIPERVACVLTMLLAVVAVLALAIGMAWLGLNVIFDFLHIILCVPAVMALYGGVYYFIHEMILKDHAMIEKLDKPVHYAFIALRAAARGAGKLAAYAARHVLPAAIRLGKNAFEKTSQMKAETRAAYRQRRYNRAHA